MIHSLQHVSVIVADTERALTFYRDVLGLPVSTQRPDLGYPGAWLDVSPTQQIHLLEVDNPYIADELPYHGGRDRHFALCCDDLSALIRALDDAGIAYTRSRSGRPALFCRDQDNNVVELVEQVQVMHGG